MELPRLGMRADNLKTAETDVTKEQPKRLAETVDSLPSPVQTKPPVASRDRRAVDLDRRGRYAEKTPPGTRTKMLKIIYENRASMEHRRRQRLIWKFAAVAIVALLSLSLLNGASHLIRDQYTHVTTQAQVWWNKQVRMSPATPRTDRVRTAAVKKQALITKQPKSSKQGKVTKKQ
jgi:hypothetical protein